MHVNHFFISKITCLYLVFISWCLTGKAQKESYKDSLLAYRKEYVARHEVVGKDDKKYIHFYDVNKTYYVNAIFKRLSDKIGFDMNTSTGKKSRYFKYGLLTFRLHDSLQHLYVYQSEALMKKKEMKDYLFVPFGDATSGFESYGGGRYIDLSIQDIKNNRVILDFNKAYNPYCAYTTGYSCPLPPTENLLRIQIPAGEKNYGKKVH